MALNNLQLNLPYGLLHLSCIQEKYIDSSITSQDQFPSDATKVCIFSCHPCEGLENCRVYNDSRKLGEKAYFIQLYSWSEIHKVKKGLAPYN